MKKYFCSLLAGCILAGSMVGAAGATQLEEIYPKDSVQITYEDAKHPNEALTTRAITKSELFSFTLNNVSDIVATYTNKTVSRSSLSNGYLRMEGTITNTSNSKDVRIGLCVSNASGDYVSKLSSDSFATNEWDYVTWPKSKVPTTECRAFVKNISANGW